MAVMRWLHSSRNCIGATLARARQFYRWRTRRQGAHAPCPTQPPCWIHSTVCEHGCALWSNLCLPCAAAMGIHAGRMILFFFFLRQRYPDIPDQRVGDRSSTPITPPTDNRKIPFSERILLDPRESKGLLLFIQTQKLFFLTSCWRRYFIRLVNNFSWGWSSL